MYSSNENQRSLEAKQFWFLEREGMLLESAKTNRIKYPSIMCGLMLAITGYFMNSSLVPDSEAQKYLVFLLIVILSISSLIIVKIVKNYYYIRFDRILYLYKKLDLNNKEIVEKMNDKRQNPKDLFSFLFFIVTLISIICCAGVLLTPIK